MCTWFSILPASFPIFPTFMRNNVCLYGKSRTFRSLFSKTDTDRAAYRNGHRYTYHSYACTLKSWRSEYLPSATLSFKRSYKIRNPSWMLFIASQPRQRRTVKMVNFVRSFANERVAHAVASDPHTFNVQSKARQAWEDVQTIPKVLSFWEHFYQHYYHQVESL